MHRLDSFQKICHITTELSGGALTVRLERLIISLVYGVKMTSVHFMSKTDLWETPQELWNQLDAEFHFEIDVCATKENSKCSIYFDPDKDGLKQDWTGVCWMNPPYGRQIGRWIEKAFIESQRHGALVVCLLPVRTDTAWWHDYVSKGEIRFIRGRLKFGGGKTSAPFPSAVVIFRPSLPVI